MKSKITQSIAAVSLLALIAACSGGSNAAVAEAEAKAREIKANGTNYSFPATFRPGSGGVSDKKASGGDYKMHVRCLNGPTPAETKVRAEKTNEFVRLTSTELIRNYRVEHPEAPEMDVRTARQMMAQVMVLAMDQFDCVHTGLVPPDQYLAGL